MVQGRSAAPAASAPAACEHALAGRRHKRRGRAQGDGRMYVTASRHRHGPSTLASSQGRTGLGQRGPEGVAQRGGLLPVAGGRELGVAGGEHGCVVALSDRMPEAVLDGQHGAVLRSALGGALGLQSPTSRLGRAGCADRQGQQGAPRPARARRGRPRAGRAPSTASKALFVVAKCGRHHPLQRVEGVAPHRTRRVTPIDQVHEIVVHRIALGRVNAGQDPSAAGRFNSAPLGWLLADQDPFLARRQPR